MKLSEEQIAHLILAYHERTLTADEKLLLEQFVSENPEYLLDLEELPVLPTEQKVYPGPVLLRHAFENISVYSTEEGHPYEKLAIGSLEGLLSSQEKDYEKQLTPDEVYANVKRSIQQTQLVADDQLVFPDYHTLLKEAPIRSINWKPYALVTSAAAAVVFAIILGEEPTNPVKPHQNATKQHASNAPSQKSVPQKVSVVAPYIPTSIQNSQVVVHPHIVDLWPRDCIVQLEYPPAEPQPEIPNAQVSSLNIVQPEAEAIASNVEPNQANPTPSAFQKEPITMKAFLLQKTNEKLFGTAQPNTDLKLETLARYASQTVGLPVRYDVESAPQHEKVVFQIGPISIERSRVKK